MTEADPTVAYARDGVVCLRGVFGSDWVEKARAGLDRQNAHPGPLSQRFTAHLGGGAFLSHLHGWRSDPDIRALALESPLPAAVAAVMGAQELRLLYDQSFTKEPGADTPTPWHHDLTFWPVEGGRLASAWVALDIVDASSGAVHFLKGSHLEPRRWRPIQPDTPESCRLANMDLPRAPDGWAAPAGSRLSFGMVPGDVLVFDARTLHGARGNPNPNRPRRALTIRYADADVRWVTGAHVLGFEPPVTLATGAPLAGPDFPLAWRG